MTPKDASNPIIDLDAILAKRQETVGSRDQFQVAAYGQTWWVMDPKLAPDEWLDDLEDLRADNASVVDLAAHYLGEDQWVEFKKAGGRASDVLEMVRTYIEMQEELDGPEGKAPRSSRSSNRAQRRQRRH